MAVRQIFYQLASVRGVVPKTESGGYKPVQRQVLKMRREGVLDWSFITDGTRWARGPRTWDSTEDALRETARLYRRNLWRSQGCRIEVWLEKEALAGVLYGTTREWGVRLMVSRGQASETYCYEAAREAHDAWVGEDTETFIYALFDSDRYGRDAAAAVERKLKDYSDGAPISFELLAVTDEQIEEWDLPTRPGKALDEGRPVVELDAIPPDKLIALVDDAITSHVDQDAWEKEQVVEQSERELLLRMSRSSS